MMTEKKYSEKDSRRKKLELLRAQLKNERSSFESHWRELSDYILPRRARFTTTDVNKGDRRNRNIIDSSPTMSARTLRSGMMSGVTSPARPWFRLTTPDPAMAELGPVKDWLHHASLRMSDAFLRSNLYNTLPTIYGDLGVFATAAMLVEEDFENVIHTQALPIGSYMISKDVKGKVNVFMRDFQMTVRQIVDTFAERKANGEIIFDNISTHVKSLWDQGTREAWIEVRHVIHPNDEYRPKNGMAKHKKYLSCYYEAGANSNGVSYLQSGDSDKYLRESGYDYFPVLCPRWETTGEDVYGTDCPGMIALGDIKQLQLGEKRLMQAIEKMVNPPMTGPSSLANQKASILPGDITYIDVREGQQGFKPAHEVNPRIVELAQKQAEVRNRIQRAFYEDLFLMLAASDRRQITAREIEERHEEKLLALGPVLEQLNQDLLDPLIDITFDILLRQRMINEPPKELSGMPLKVEYISIMAAAQKLVGISGMERFTGFVGQLAAVNPEVLDKVDADQLVDEYGEAVGISPLIIRSDEKVEEMRSQRQQAAAQQQQAEQMAQSASAVKDLSQAQLGGDQDNVLTRMIDNATAGQII